MDRPNPKFLDLAEFASTYFLDDYLEPINPPGDEGKRTCLVGAVLNDSAPRRNGFTPLFLKWS